MVLWCLVLVLALVSPRGTPIVTTTTTTTTTTAAASMATTVCRGGGCCWSGVEDKGENIATIGLSRVFVQGKPKGA